MASLTLEDLIDVDGLYSSSRSSRSSTSTAPSITSVSAFRRFTRSPSLTIRSGLRRTVTGNASTDSLVSQEPRNRQQSSSCVSQQTSRDDCSLSRFIAWTAVRRNASKGMTPEQKRECPLLLCQKRFPNQELMLQHLAACDKLFDGEYWCYDCKKKERFTEAKCTRCLGHPSKRRKIAKLAKSIFSTLGHKPKAGSTHELDLLADEEPYMRSQPTTEDPVFPRPGESELENLEIHELDSLEMPLSPILEGEEGMTLSEGTCPLPSLLSPSLVPLRSDSSPYRSDGLRYIPANWSEKFPPNPAVDAEHSEVGNRRPILHVQTTGIVTNRTRSFKRRCSGRLSHSSSTRSNASTVSTNSTSSAASGGAVSTMSDWSTRQRNMDYYGGYDSPITSPLEEYINVDDFFPPTKEEIHRGSCQQTITSASSGPAIAQTVLVAELPGDMPVLEYPKTSTCQAGSDSIFSEPPLPFASTSTTPPEQSGPSNSFPSQGPFLPDFSDSEFTSWPTPLVNSPSLVHTFKGALDTHVANSRERLGSIRNNAVIGRFMTLSPSEIAATGLELLTASLQGHIFCSDPVRLLCFVHLAYSLSLVMHENKAPDRWTELFYASVSHCSALSGSDRTDYLNTIVALWTPSGVSDDELRELFIKYDSGVSLNKGKQNACLSQDNPAGPLVFASQDFLDEFEYLALRDNTCSDVVISELSARHIEDHPPEAPIHQALVQSLIHLLNQLQEQYGANTLFSESMKQIAQGLSQRQAPTARRLELELIHAGRTHLPPELFMSSFVGEVRNRVDGIYLETANYYSSRTSYHLAGVKLMRMMLQSLDPAAVVPEPLVATRVPSPTWIDDFVESLSLEMTSTLDTGTYSFTSNTRADTCTNLHASSSSSLSTCPLSSGPTDMDLHFGMQPIAFDITVDDASLVTPPLSATAMTMSPACFSATSSTTATAVPASPCDTTATASGASAGGGDLSFSTPDAAITPEAAGSKVESNSSCDICGYRPKGHPKWFAGSMAKHRKLQHAEGPPKIYRCPYKGCKSQYKNRPDNLRQHQIDKGHFVDGQEGSRRSGKRKRED